MSRACSFFSFSRMSSRTRQRGVAVANLAILLALTAGVAGLTDDDCDGGCYGSVDWKSIKAELSALKTTITGPTTFQTGARVTRVMTIENQSGYSATQASVEYTVPAGATNVTISGGTAYPLGDGSYRIQAPVNPEGQAPPLASVVIAYDAPATPGECTETAIVTVGNEDDGHQATCTIKSLATSGGSGSPGETLLALEPASPPWRPQPRHAGPASAAAQADIRSWAQWAHVPGMALNTERCQQLLDAAQGGAYFLALSFPAAELATAQAGVFQSPVVVRGSTRPYLLLLDYTRPEGEGREVLRLPLELDRAHLPVLMGSGLAASGGILHPLRAAATPKATCPQNLSIPDGKWEWATEVPLDFGDAGSATRGPSFESYGCYAGSAPPLPFGTVAAIAAGVAWFQDNGITCMGPSPVHLEAAGNAALSLSGPVGARVRPPERVEQPHTLYNLSYGDLTVTATSVSSQGLPWKLYLGGEDTPDLNHPVSGPVTLPRGASPRLWAVVDVPALGSPLGGGRTVTQGAETHTLTVTSTADPDHPAVSTDLLWLGEWKAPPAQTTPASWWIQVGSHAPGAGQSQWRTDLGVLVPPAPSVAGEGSASVEVRLHNTSSVESRTFTVAHGEQQVLEDVVGQLPYAGSGAIEVRSATPLIVSSRTYNQVPSTATCFPGGTFGQAYEAHRPGAGMVAGQSAWLAQLVETSAFRTNIALTNMSSSAAAVTVTLFDGAGDEVGSYPVTLVPGEWKQENRPFLSRFGRTNVQRGYARVTVDSGAGVLASASVVDNLTNDPTTIPMISTGWGALIDTWIQVGSHAPGANQSRWRTDLGLLNPFPSQASVEVRLHSGTGTKSNTTTVAPFGQAILTDVVGQIPDDGSGALQVVSDQAQVVTSRTYNLVGDAAACYPKGTFGQRYDAVRASLGLKSGEHAWLPQLREDARFRTNIALTNMSSSAAQVRVTLYGGAGTALTSYDVSLAPGEWKQANRPFRDKAGQTALAAGYAKVAVLTGSGVLASASVVDNTTNDPTTLAAVRPPPAGEEWIADVTINMTEPEASTFPIYGDLVVTPNGSQVTITGVYLIGQLAVDSVVLAGTLAGDVLTITTNQAHVQYGLGGVTYTEDFTFSFSPISLSASPVTSSGTVSLVRNPGATTESGTFTFVARRK